MSDLQDALDTVDTAEYGFYEELAIIVEAARRVVNPDIEAATAITNQLRFIKTGDEWDDLIYDITKEAVDVALSVTEETEQPWPCEHGFDAPHVFIPGGGYYPPGTKTTDLTAMPWEVCIGVMEDER